MFVKWIFDRVVSLLGLLVLWPVLLIVAVLGKVKMPGGPAFFVQKRVGRHGKLFNCHKFRTMKPTPVPSQGGRENKQGWSTVSVAGDSRITPFGAKLRHYKLDELPGLWDVLIGNMSFVGPRPDVPGYADKLQGDDRRMLELRPGITGPATLKYRLEDEMIAEWIHKVRGHTEITEITERLRDESKGHTDFLRLADAHISDKVERTDPTDNVGGAQVKSEELKVKSEGSLREKSEENLNKNLPKDVESMTDQELAVWYNDNVIYPDKVRINLYYLDHYSFIKDIQMIFCTVLGRKMKYGGEMI